MTNERLDFIAQDNTSLIAALFCKLEYKYDMIHLCYSSTQATYQQ